VVYSDFEDRTGTATDIAVLGIPVGTDMDPFRRKAAFLGARSPKNFLDCDP